MLRYLVFSLLVIPFYGQPSYAYSNFDDCLKAISSCAEFRSGKPTTPPKKLKAFLEFVVSAKERAKYECVKKSFSPNQPVGFCAAPVKQFDFHTACNKDILKFCKKIKHGEHRLTTCLGDHYSKLSNQCQEQVSPPPTIPDGLREIPDHSAE